MNKLFCHIRYLSVIYIKYFKGLHHMETLFTWHNFSIVYGQVMDCVSLKLSLFVPDLAFNL